MTTDLNRREFPKAGGAVLVAGAVAARDVAASTQPAQAARFAAAPMDTLRS
jgi:hypothetical protein